MAEDYRIKEQNLLFQYRVVCQNVIYNFKNSGAKVSPNEDCNGVSTYVVFVIFQNFLIMGMWKAVNYGVLHSTMNTYFNHKGGFAVHYLKYVIAFCSFTSLE